MGASWEGLLLEQVVRRLGARWDQCWFWRTHGGAELDLLVQRGTRRLGFEFKRTSAPSTTRSMHSAIADLELDSLTVIHAGADSYPLAPRIEAVAARRILEDLEPL